MKIFTLLQNLLTMITGQTSRNLAFSKRNAERETLKRETRTLNTILHSNKSVQHVNASVQNNVTPANDASVSFEYKILPVQKR